MDRASKDNEELEHVVLRGDEEVETFQVRLNRALSNLI